MTKKKPGRRRDQYRITPKGYAAMNEITVKEERSIAYVLTPQARVYLAGYDAAKNEGENNGKK